MVKRIILWKIKDDQNKQANLNFLKESLLSLSNKINDIISAEVGLNFSSADYDIIYIVAFADPFILKQFQSHPEYQKVFQQAQSLSTNMIFCDFMTENSTSATPSNVATNIPNSGNIPNSNGIQPNNNMNNNIGANGMFGNSFPKQEPAFDNTKPFSPITNKQSPPFAGGRYTNSNNANNGNSNHYTGFGNMSQSKTGVNFTTSESVNQIRFANNKNTMDSNSDSWKCSKCGKTNASFINMCSCGRRKPTDTMTSLPNIPPIPNQQNESADSWQCPTCGKTNNNFMKVCVCGHHKAEPNPQNNNMGFGGNGGAPSPSPMGFNKPNMQMPKNPAMGMNNIKSPNNNDFFNNFNNVPQPPNGTPMANNRMGGPNRMNPTMNKPPSNTMNGNSMGYGNGMMNMNKSVPGNMPPDSWKCPRCGKVLGNFVGQCVCGQRKPPRPMGGGGGNPMRFN